jgi:hypothetical protein
MAVCRRLVLLVFCNLGNFFLSQLENQLWIELEWQLRIKLEDELKSQVRSQLSRLQIVLLWAQLNGTSG